MVKALTEAERQLLLMALAHLSVERPGWYAALNRLAVKVDDARAASAEVFEEFRRMHQRATAPEQARKGNAK